MLTLLCTLLTLTTTRAQHHHPHEHHSSHHKLSHRRSHHPHEHHSSHHKLSHRRSRPNSHAGSRARIFATATQPNTLDVAAFGAKPDNSTDNTQSFQKALDACHSAGGGEVFIGTGIFRFHGNISIPPGCTLSGTFTVVPSHDLRSNTPQKVLSDGTVLIPTGGRDLPGGCDLDCTSYFINVGPNAVLRGLVIYYQQQETTATPVPYPWYAQCYLNSSFFL